MEGALISDGVMSANTVSTSYATLFSKGVYLRAGSQVFIEAWGSHLEDSGASRTKTLKLTCGSFTHEFNLGGPWTQNATNLYPIMMLFHLVVSANNKVTANAFIHLAGIAGNNVAAFVSVAIPTVSWNSTSDDVTGAQTIALAIKSNSDTATQTFNLFGYSVTTVPYVP